MSQSSYMQPHLAKRLSAPAALRNREPIRQALAAHLPSPASVLEIASGTGEHALYLSDNLAQVTCWQPTDIDSAALESINAWQADATTKTLLSAAFFDVLADTPPPLATFNTLIAINMVHIAPWTATEGLMRLANRHLSVGGVVYLYGPYWQSGVEPAPSNLAFDASLRERNPLWGIRHLDEVVELARCHQLHLKTCIDMPANNLSVIFIRKD
ncbi:DUF938 domain-containing protein [Nitrincola nitratireducens]|uniref:SAM-dependent methyltransferase n=1 Tax=Nitrincola nitratireducens TaxID=1229521 RepID=W9V245_9GAMM|nr:DUF938 domain-containing protein [Nitrincola nitratireducens]EXJ10232.1 hypothetical protein D791_02790 [Nitrincola nitratireducens]